MPFHRPRGYYHFQVSSRPNTLTQKPTRNSSGTPNNHEPSRYYDVMGSAESVAMDHRPCIRPVCQSSSNCKLQPPTHYRVNAATTAWDGTGWGHHNFGTDPLWHGICRSGSRINDVLESMEEDFSHTTGEGRRRRGGCPSSRTYSKNGCSNRYVWKIATKVAKVWRMIVVVAVVFVPECFQASSGVFHW